MFIFKKITVLILVFAILFGILCIPINVNANEIMPYAYYDPSVISFRGSFNGTSNYYDGNYMAFEATATSSDGASKEIIITVYIESTGTTHRYKTYTDGVARKADYIPVGSGSRAIISASCADSSVTINLDLKMYSWSE